MNEYMKVNSNTLSIKRQYVFKILIKKLFCLKNHTSHRKSFKLFLRALFKCIETLVYFKCTTYALKAYFLRLGAQEYFKNDRFELLL